MYYNNPTFDGLFGHVVKFDNPEKKPAILIPEDQRGWTVMRVNHHHYSRILRLKGLLQYEVEDITDQE